MTILSCLNLIDYGLKEVTVVKPTRSARRLKTGTVTHQVTTQTGSPSSLSVSMRNAFVPFKGK